MSTAYRHTDPPKRPAYRWWVSVVHALSSASGAMTVFLITHCGGCGQNWGPTSTDPKDPPCQDTLYTGNGGEYNKITCSHKNQALEIVTYQHSGAVLCKCKAMPTPALPAPASSSDPIQPAASTAAK